MKENHSAHTTSIKRRRGCERMVFIFCTDAIFPLGGVVFPAERFSAERRTGRHFHGGERAGDGKAGCYAAGGTDRAINGTNSSQVLGRDRGAGAGHSCPQSGSLRPQSPAYHHLWPTRCRQNGGGKTGAGGSQRTAAFPFFS
ncbi:unknown [Firmicutes bacterium CAG:466]|nr:unknown [Firmicutes bacterium CAG:466]